MTPTNPTTNTELRNVLAALYPDQASMERILYDAGLDRSRFPIDQATTAINLWQQILSEAEKQNGLVQIVDCAYKEYPNNKPLERAIRSSGLESVINSFPQAKPSVAPPIAPSVVPGRAAAIPSKYILLLLLMLIASVCVYWFRSPIRIFFNGSDPPSVLATPLPTATETSSENRPEIGPTHVPLNEIGPRQVVVCSEPNFDGDCRVLKDSVDSFNDATLYGELSKQIASVRLADNSKIEVRLYQDENLHENPSRFEVTITGTEFDLRQRHEATTDWNSLEIIPLDSEAAEIVATKTISSPGNLPDSLYVQSDAITEGLYLVNGTEVDSIEVGRDLVVYAEIIPGTEVAIAVVKVVGRNPDSLTVQPILVSPERKIRPTLRVDTQVDNLATSELIPAAAYAIGYLLDEGKVALRPDLEIMVGQQIQALKLEKIDSTVVDALPFNPPIIMQVIAIGRTGNVASVELTTGEWPLRGTLVELYSE